MGIEIYFRDKLLGTVTIKEDKINYGGEVRAIRPIVEHYRRQGYDGKDLLRILLERLRGNCWAKEIKE